MVTDGYQRPWHRKSTVGVFAMKSPGMTKERCIASLYVPPMHIKPSVKLAHHPVSYEPRSTVMMVMVSRNGTASGKL